MRKTLCDLCGGEVGAKTLFAEFAEGKVCVSLASRAGDQDVCKYCMIDAFKKLNDRPAPIVPPSLDPRFSETPPPPRRLAPSVLSSQVHPDAEPHTPRFVGKAPELGAGYGAEMPGFYSVDAVRGIARFVDVEKARWVVHPETGDVLKANTAKSPLKITPRTPTDAMLKAGRETGEARVSMVWEEMWKAFEP